MPNYVEKHLIKGENIIYRASISRWPFTPLYVLATCCLIAWGIGLLMFWIIHLARQSREVVITNKRVISKAGIVSRQTIEMNLKKIESLQVSQGILGRMFNFGSIVLSGAGNPLEKSPIISNPMEFRRVFLETQEELMNSPNQDVALKTFEAKVRLKGQGTTEAQVQAYTIHNAKDTLISKYGKGSIIGEPVEVAS